MPVRRVLKYLPQSSHRYLWQRTNRRDGLPWMEILRIDRQNESFVRKFSPPQCGQAFLPVHLASNTGGICLITFSIAKSRKPIKNLSTGPSLLFFGRKIKAALVGIPTLFGMPIFLSRRYAPVFEVEPPLGTFWPYFLRSTQKKAATYNQIFLCSLKNYKKLHLQLPQFTG